VSAAGGTSFDLSSYLSGWRDEVDKTLDQVLPAEDVRPSTLHRAMRYSVFAGGKRVRPILAVAACEAVGTDPRLCLRTGAAIEMVHTYSLIHDDLPAMDDDELRRGKPTCHIKFGEAMAILAGDGLLTEAFGAIAADEELEVGTRIALVSELARAAGTSGMVAGQVVDIETECAEFGEDDVNFIHLNKTAAMVEMSVRAGAIVGHASEGELDDLSRYGRSIGLAFQVIDDVLNVTGGKDLGKGVGTDAARGKATYPALFGVDESRRRAEALRREAADALCGFDGRARALLALAELVVNRLK